MNQADLYAVLGVARDATPEQLKRSFRKLAAKWHPDKPGGSEERFREIEEAYRTLSDPQDRAYYDHHGQAPPSKQPTNENAEVYSMLAGAVAAVINGLGPNGKVESLDLIAALRKKIHEGEKDLAQQAWQMATERGRFMAVIKRLRKKHGTENQLAAVLQTQIDGMGLELDKAKHFIEIGRRGLKMLEDYEYDFVRGLSYFGPDLDEFTADGRRIVRRPVDFKWGH